MGLRNARFFLTVCFVVLTATSGSANLIINGSFEEGAAPQDSWYRLMPGSDELTGWVIGGEGVDWHFADITDPAANFGPAFTGVFVIDLNLDGTTAGTIAQTIPTDIGAHYELIFHMAGVDWFSNPRLVHVDVADQSLDFAQPASNDRILQYGEFSVIFSAVDTQTTITFSSPDASGFWGPILDEISVESTVPTEPGTWSDVKALFR